MIYINYNRRKFDNLPVKYRTYFFQQENGIEFYYLYEKEVKVKMINNVVQNYLRLYLDDIINDFLDYLILFNL